MAKLIVLVFVAVAGLPVPYARADYAAGMEAYKNKDYPTALAQLQPEAGQGNRIAQNLVGVIYMNGLGVSPNDVEAAKWYRMAAEQGYAVAQTNLGFLYENGRGVNQSLSDARKWYEKAASQGDPRAGAMLRNLEVKEKVQRQALGGKSTEPPPTIVASVKPTASTADHDKLQQGISKLS